MGEIAPGDLELVETPTPALQDGEVLADPVDVVAHDSFSLVGSGPAAAQATPRVFRTLRRSRPP